VEREDPDAALQSDLQKLIGCTLNGIGIWPFHIDFVFLEDMRIFVRITKEFKFALGRDDEFHFDPGLTGHDTFAESPKFVFLRGLQCQSALLDATKFEVGFQGGARLWVERAEKDFEPVHLIGASGEHSETLAFYRIVG
jgi:hypothetical protein